MSPRGSAAIATLLPETRRLLAVAADTWLSARPRQPTVPASAKAKAVGEAAERAAPRSRSPRDRSNDSLRAALQESPRPRRFLRNNDSLSAATLSPGDFQSEPDETGAQGDSFFLPRH